MPRTGSTRTRALPVAAALLCCLGAALAQGTPPVSPRVQEVELPPAIELGAPARVPPDLPQRPLTADEAARIALYTHPVVTSAGASVARAQARVDELRTGFDPALTLSATVGAVADRNDGLGDQHLFSATINKLIHDFDHTRHLVNQATAFERSADAVLTGVQMDLVLRVKLAFYVCLQRTRLVRVSEANVLNQQEHLALARARLNSGLGLPMDVVRAETAFAEAVYALTVARNNALQGRVNLAELMGIDPRTPLQPAEAAEPDLPVDDVNRLVELALGQRPELLAAQAEIEARRYAIMAARTSSVPVVSGSVGLQHRGGEATMRDDSISLGVSVAWNAWEGRTTDARVRQAEADLVASEATLTALELAVIAEVSQAYLDLKSAEQRVAVAEAQLTNARETRRLAEGRYRAGLGMFLDVTDAQTALETADVNGVNAASALDLARVALAHAVGANVLPEAQPAP